MSSVLYEKARSLLASSLQPTTAAVAAVTRAPTRTIAPNTWTSKATLQLSGLTNASMLTLRA